LVSLDEAREMIGQVQHQPEALVIKKEFQRWAAAVGDLNPLYFDEQYARSAGHQDVVMPPLFLPRVMDGVWLPDQIRPDGIADEGGLKVLLGAKRVHGKAELEFNKSVYPGEIIRAEITLAGAEPKTGRSGKFIVVTWETVYINKHGLKVGKITDTMIDR
jgi:acyl dehydratase